MVTLGADAKSSHSCLSMHSHTKCKGSLCGYTDSYKSIIAFYKSKYAPLIEQSTAYAYIMVQSSGKGQN